MKQEYVVSALDKLERKYKARFRDIFKSITMDNGTEFLNTEGIERSCIHRVQKRTTTFYCHPYNSCERGSNENANRIIRRFIPKSTDIEQYTDAEVSRIQEWMNNYPRRILGYRSSRELFDQFAAAG